MSNGTWIMRKVAVEMLDWRSGELTVSGRATGDLSGVGAWTSRSGWLLTAMSV